MKKTNSITWTMIVALFCCLALAANATLIVQHDGEDGITTTFQSGYTGVSQWDDQAAAGGDQDFTEDFSQRPLLFSSATSHGQDALRFDGVNDNMDFAATSSFDSDPSLTFMMVLRPLSLSGNQTYLNSTVSGASGGDNGWGLYLIGGNFAANVREAVGGASSTISATGWLNDWIILSGVYDSSAKTVQLFLTDEAGNLQTGAAQSVDMVDGAHLGTQIGVRTLTGTTDPANVDIAAIRIWDEALSDSARLAAEGALRRTYFLPEPSTVMLLALGGGMLGWWRRRQT